MLIRVFAVNNQKIRSVLFKISGSKLYFHNAVGVDEPLDPEPVEKTVLLLPPLNVSQRGVDILLKERKKLRDVLPHELKGSLASDSADNVFDCFTIDGDKALCFWIDKGRVKDILAENKFGSEFDSLTVATPAWGRIIPKSSDDSYTLLSDGESCAVAHNGNIVLTRPVSEKLEDELSRTAFAFELNQGVKISAWYLFGEAYTSFASNRENFPPIAQPLPLSENITGYGYPDDSSALECASFAAVAMEVALGEPIEFLRDDLAPRKNLDAAVIRVKIALSLTIIFLILLFGELELKRRLILKDINSVDISISAIYKEIFPNRKPVDEAAEIKGEIRRLNSSSQSAEILKSLRYLAQLKGDKMSRVTEYEADGFNIRIKGEASAIDAVNEFKGKLSSSFSDLTLADSSRKPDGTVIFSLSGRAGGVK